YDGYELRHFRHDPNDPYSISDNKIKKIAEAPDGNFWVGTQVGLNFFNLKNRRFKHYSDTTKHGIGKVEINDLALDKNGTLWVATVNGLFKFDPDTDQFTREFPVSKNSAANIVSLEPAGQGIYLAQPDALFFFQESGGARHIAVPPHAGFIRDLYTGMNGLLWIGASNGLFCLDQGTQQITEIAALRETSVNAMTRQGDQWLICTNKGMYVLQPATRAVEGPLYVQLNGINQQVNHLRLAYTASNGITWFCSNTRKLYKTDVLKERFRHAPIDLMEPMKGPSAFCELFEYSPGVLLIPRTEGASLFDIYTGKITRFPYAPPYNREGWNKGVTCFLEAGDSLLWIGTVGGLFLLDQKRGRFEPLEKQFSALEQLRSVSIRKIHRDRKGNLWLATWGHGLFKIDFRLHAIRQYNNSIAHQTAYINASRTILETRNGDLWFGTRGGLLKYLEEKDSFLVYRNIPSAPASMSENTAFCLYEDVDGNIWSGSYGGGLNHLDVKTGKFRHYTTGDGLLNNNVFSLIPDQKNNLWLLTFNGITLFNPVQKTFRTFTHNQGLLNTVFDAFLYGKSRFSNTLCFSNTLFFGGTKGIDYFYPERVSASNHTARVWFTDFKLFNEPVAVSGDTATEGKFTLPQDLLFTKQITLRYDQNVISFDYAALDYSSPQTIEYAYQLVGFDTAWQYVRDKRSVTFTNLNPGSYTLKIKASNSDGVWDNEERYANSILITVMPPWWHSWPFRISVLLAVAGMVTALYNYRIRQIRERETLKTALNQRIAQVKMEALRSQMNPHFVFNCLSSLKLFVEKNETEKASDHISKFATLLRRVLDDARTETETITLERELDTLKRYVELEMIRFKEKFEFRMDISPGINLQNIEIPPLILQPYVENAILHGLQHKTDGKGVLLVQVLDSKDHVKIVVEDNGVGREAAKAIKARNPVPQPSHGLNVTAERLEYFSQKHNIRTSVETTDLRTSDGNASGTRVMLTFQTD
ncbi:MAG: histidine kinase, partial [Thermoanaerobaculia bacterium]|nr:histidine kinase [Thermoanaerobaculia bacterium]